MKPTGFSFPTASDPASDDQGSREVKQVGNGRADFGICFGHNCWDVAFGARLSNRFDIAAQ